MKMQKIVSICCVLFLVLQHVQSKKLQICLPKHKNIGVEEAKLSFEKTFDKLKAASDEINIPGNYPIKLNITGLISGDVSVSNLTLGGYKNITLKIFPNLLTPFELILNSINIRGENYNMSTAISDLFDLYGDGKFKIDLGKISVEGTDLVIWPVWPTQCINFNLKMKLGKMEANFDNLMGGDQTLNAVINHVIGDLGPDIIDYYWPDIYQYLQPVLQKIIDEIENYMNKSEIEDLLKIIVADQSVRTKYLNTTFNTLGDSNNII